MHGKAPLGTHRDSWMHWKIIFDGFLEWILRNAEALRRQTRRHLGGLSSALAFDPNYWGYIGAAAP